MPFVIEVDEESLTTTLDHAQGFVLLDLWAPWCAPCRTLGPILQRLASSTGSRLQVAKLDVERHPEAMSRFRVRSIPTLLLFKGGVEVSRSVGLKSLSQLSEWLETTGVATEPLAVPVAPAYPAFYGDASLKAFLWQRLEDHAIAGELEGGSQAYWRDGVGTPSAALVHCAETDVFERVTGLRAAFASILDMVEPLTPNVVAELGAALQPGANLEELPVGLFHAFLSEPTFDWPGLLQDAPVLDQLRREWLVGCDLRLRGESHDTGDFAIRLAPFAEHDDVSCQSTSALLAALTPIPAVDDGDAWRLVHARAARLIFVLGRHAAQWSPREQNMETFRHRWFRAREQELPTGAFTDATLDVAQAQWSREQAAYQIKETAFFETRGWQTITARLCDRLIALLHEAPLRTGQP